MKLNDTITYDDIGSSEDSEASCEYSIYSRDHIDREITNIFTKNRIFDDVKPFIDNADNDTAIGYIHSLFVSEEYRENGIGSQLMKAFCEIADKQYAITFLIADPFNTEEHYDLLEFYNKFDFIVIAKEDTDFPILMREPQVF